MQDRRLVAKISRKLLRHNAFNFAFLPRAEPVFYWVSKWFYAQMPTDNRLPGAFVGMNLVLDFKIPKNLRHDFSICTFI